MADRFDYLVLTPSDFEQSLAFYRDILGWHELESLEGRSAAHYVILSGGGVRIMLRKVSADGSARATLSNAPSRTPSTPTLHLDIHDVHNRFGRLSAGLHVVAPPGLDEFGRLHFVLRDPDGNLLVFNELRQR